MERCRIPEGAVAPLGNTGSTGRGRRGNFLPTTSVNFFFLPNHWLSSFKAFFPNSLSHTGVQGLALSTSSAVEAAASPGGSGLPTARCLEGGRRREGEGRREGQRRELEAAEGGGGVRHCPPSPRTQCLCARLPGTCCHTGPVPSHVTSCHATAPKATAQL